MLDAEILALDPGRNTSRVRACGVELSALYLPGHLRGDRIQLFARADELRVHSAPGENRIPLRLESREAFAHLVELTFTGSICVLAPRDQNETPGRQDWYVEFPPAALRLPGSFRGA